jgi:hypothetical protein
MSTIRKNRVFFRPFRIEMYIKIVRGVAHKLSALIHILFLNIVFAGVYLHLLSIFGKAQYAIKHQKQDIVLAKTGYMVFPLFKKAKRCLLLQDGEIKIDADHITTV